MTDIIDSSRWRTEHIGGQTLILGDCLEVLPTLAAGSVDAVVTDPPYGCGKAEWDGGFPVAWYLEARRIGGLVATITGSSGLKDSIAMVGSDFVGCIAAWNRNGCTRGSLGFGNWLAVVVSCSRPRRGQDFFSFSIVGDMPDHPSPKPAEFMVRLVERVTEPGATVLDPFLGSGTTLVAAELLGRRGIGIEISPEYFDVACRRVEDATKQPRLFSLSESERGEPPPALFGAEEQL
jgi:DNA modification methylase